MQTGDYFILVLFSCHLIFNSLANKNLDQSKLKAFADDKLNVAYMLIFVFVRVENIVGKGENAG